MRGSTEKLQAANRVIIGGQVTKDRYIDQNNLEEVRTGKPSKKIAGDKEIDLLAEAARKSTAALLDRLNMDSQEREAFRLHLDFILTNHNGSAVDFANWPYLATGLLSDMREPEEVTESFFEWMGKPLAERYGQETADEITALRKRVEEARP